jgi:hypothetical protein
VTESSAPGIVAERDALFALELRAAGLNQHSTAASVEYTLLRCALLFRSNHPTEAAETMLNCGCDQSRCAPLMRAIVAPHPTRPCVKAEGFDGTCSLWHRVVARPRTFCLRRR